MAQATAMERKTSFENLLGGAAPKSVNDSSSIARERTTLGGEREVEYLLRYFRRT